MVDAAALPEPQIPASYQVQYRTTRVNNVAGASLRLPQIDAPSQKIFAGEVVTNVRGLSWINWVAPSNWNSLFVGHLGTSNYLFLDGHVKAMRPTQTITPFNMWGYYEGTPTAVTPVDADCSVAWNINCDTPYPAVVTALAAREAATQ